MPLGIPPPKIYDEIDARNEAALAPHFAFVRTLIALAAGLLGLSAPQATAQDHFRAQLSFWAMLCLGSAIVLGAIALYGEVNIHLAAIRRYRKLLKKHQGKHVAAYEEAEESGTITPPPIHSAAFRIQCVILFIGIFLLVWSKLPVAPAPSPSAPIPAPTPIVQPQKTP